MDLLLLDAAFHWSNDPQRAWDRLYQTTQKVLTLDDSNCGALALMTRYDVMRRQFDQALAHAERAVATNPNCSNGYWMLSDTLIFARKPHEAISAAEEATRLDPARSDFYAYLIGRALYTMGRPEQAIPFLQRHAAAFPKAPYIHVDLAICLC